LAETTSSEVFGDVRYNAVFFMLGIVCIGVSFALLAASTLLVYLQGGSVSSLATEYALLITLAAALGGVGFMALGVGALVFSLNYEPIRQEARLVGLSAIPYGIFMLAIHFARLGLEGSHDFFQFAVQRDASGTPTLIFVLPESYAALGPYQLLGTFAFTICFFGLSLFMSNMKIVKDVGGWTVTLTRMVGILALLGQAFLLAGYSPFTAEATDANWYGVPFGLYIIGYLILASVVPVLGAIVAFRTGTVFWDAAKTVRYLSDFRKRAQTAAASRAKHASDDRKWWERIADEEKEDK